jgi:hypothetical protein
MNHPENIREFTPIVLAGFGCVIAVTTILSKPSVEITIAAFGLSGILFGAASGSTSPLSSTKNRIHSDAPVKDIESAEVPLTERLPHTPIQLEARQSNQ